MLIVNSIAPERWSWEGSILSQDLWILSVGNSQPLKIWQQTWVQSENLHCGFWLYFLQAFCLLFQV